RYAASGVWVRRSPALGVTPGGRVAEGIITCARRVPPLTHLRMVQHHGAYMEERASTLLRAGTGIGWAIATLDYFGGLTPMIAGARRVLGASVNLGAPHLSLRDV